MQQESEDLANFIAFVEMLWENRNDKKTKRFLTKVQTVVPDIMVAKR